MQFIAPHRHVRGKWSVLDAVESERRQSHAAPRPLWRRLLRVLVRRMSLYRCKQVHQPPVSAFVSLDWLAIELWYELIRCVCDHPSPENLDRLKYWILFIACVCAVVWCSMETPSLSTELSSGGAFWTSRWHLMKRQTEMTSPHRFVLLCMSTRSAMNLLFHWHISSWLKHECRIGAVCGEECFLVLHSFPAEAGSDVEMQKAQRQLLRLIASCHLTAVFFVADSVPASPAAASAAPALPPPTSSSPPSTATPTAAAAASGPSETATESPEDNSGAAAGPVGFPGEEESEAQKEAKLDKLVDCLHAQACTCHQARFDILYSIYLWNLGGEIDGSTR